MTYLSAKQKKEALSSVIELAEMALISFGNKPGWDETKWREAVNALYYARTMRDDYNA